MLYVSKVFSRNHMLLEKNLSYRAGVPPSEFLVREVPEAPKTIQSSCLYFKNYLFVCLSILSASMCIIYVPGAHKSSEEDPLSSWTGLQTAMSQPTHGCLEPRLGPPQEKQVLLKTEPFLHSLAIIFGSPPEVDKKTCCWRHHILCETEKTNWTWAMIVLLPSYLHCFVSEGAIQVSGHRNVISCITQC